VRWLMFVGVLLVGVLGLGILSPNTLGAIEAVPDPQAPSVAPIAPVQLGAGALDALGETGRERASNAVLILLTLTVLSIAPAILLMMTCFTRILIVFGFVRRALGLQTLPPNQILIGLSFFMTLFIMAPTTERLYDEVWVPYQAESLDDVQALAQAGDIMRTFLGQHTRRQDLALFVQLRGGPPPASLAETPMTVLIPAFMISELKTAFQMGFVIFLPFIVIDLVISAVLMALGMMMLPPVIVSLPFKILLFVLVDGWSLLIRGLVASYGGVS
jgi:flagellar biosynthetic protein FliP